MRVIKKYKSEYPGDVVAGQMEKIVDWDKFSNDSRTSNVDFYISMNAPNESEIDRSRVNIFFNMENPGTWMGFKSARHNINAERYIDYMVCHCPQTYHGRKDKSLGSVYIQTCLPYDFDSIRNNILNSEIDIDSIKKDKDVFLCGSTLQMNPEFAVTPWVKTMMDNFNFTLCSQDSRQFNKPLWEDKMIEALRSKAAIVWTGFFHGMWHPDHNRRKAYTIKNHEFIKFKKIGEGSAIHDMTPSMTYRVLDAAFSRSIMLCYKNPFAGGEFPHSQAIENYLVPGEDFIYFEDSNDLKLKLLEILRDYDSKKYKDMIDSCYSKINKKCNINDWYENYVVSSAKRGKIL